MRKKEYQKPRDVWIFSDLDVKTGIVLVQKHIEYLKNQPSEVIKDDIQLSRDLVYIAKKDIEASRILKDNKILSLAMFHLQQATEKTAKAIGLATHLVHREDLYGKKGAIGHDPIEAYNKVLEKLNELDIDFLRIYTGKTAKKLRKIVGDNKEIEKVQEAKVILGEWKRISSSINKKLKNWTKDRNLHAQLKFVIKVNFNLKKDQEEVVENILEYIPNYIMLLHATVGVYILAHVTKQHGSSTRYPDKDPKPQDYDSEKVLKLEEMSMLINDITSAAKHVDDFINDPWGIRELIENVKS